MGQLLDDVLTTENGVAFVQVLERTGKLVQVSQTLNDKKVCLVSFLYSALIDIIYYVTGRVYQIMLW